MDFFLCLRSCDYDELDLPILTLIMCVFIFGILLSFIMANCEFYELDVEGASIFLRLWWRMRGISIRP